MAYTYNQPTISPIKGFQDSAGGVGPGGFNGVVDFAAGKISDAAAGINTQLQNFDATDPGQLLKMQQALANYNLSITVTSSIIKSLEDTVKSVAQKL
jgi:type III secretion apparatus needle protein